MRKKFQIYGNNFADEVKIERPYRAKCQRRKINYPRDINGCLVNSPKPDKSNMVGRPHLDTNIKLAIVRR